MIETSAILEFAEDLIRLKTDTYCSELQRRILSDALQEERKTYDQLAEECGYSARYVKQDVAPKLWLLISQAVEEKVNKANVRAVLEAAMRTQGAATITDSINSTTDANSLTVSSVLLQPFNKTKANVLLVDDQPQNLKLLSDLLEEQGYEVQQAINGAIALQAISASSPDLILLDIHMPQMDGYTLCQLIKADTKTADIPVIFVSAIDASWDKVKAFSAGGCDYITKPFKVVEVLARVENHLKIQQLQKALTAQNVKLQQAIQELQRLAAIDEITQVASRRRFDAYLLECWQRAEHNKESLTLLLAQIENVGFYSDRRNDHLGDSMLRKIAQVIQQSTRGSRDLVSRYGTFTFAVLLPQQTREDGEAIAQDIRRQIKMLIAKTETAQTADISLNAGIVSVSFPSEKATYSGLGEFLEAGERTLHKVKDVK